MNVHAEEHILEELKRCWEGGRKGFLLIKNLEKDKIFKSYQELLNGLMERNTEKISHQYRQLFYLLADYTEKARETMVGDAWQNYLLDFLIRDSNPFSEKASQVTLFSMGCSLKKAFQEDLKLLESLYLLDGQKITRAVQAISTHNAGSSYSLKDLKTFPPHPEKVPAEEERYKLKDFLSHLKDWEKALEALAEFYFENGAGYLAEYWAFRWEEKGSRGRLNGIAYPDYVKDEDLVGYKRQREQIWENTEHLLAGFPANNILLYGKRGTGKSSTVKALLSRYGSKGLRLIEIPKRHFLYFPDIFRLLRSKPQKFILFVDDLSFEEEEVSYKELKGLLEGGLENKPGNVVVYATSNRRHLVREFFHDQESKVVSDGGETRMSDTVQEKMSLADRFGITVIFPLPGQEEYLEMVEKMAAQRKLDVPTPVLREKALAWEKWQNSRSGRTARQFIDYTAGICQKGNSTR